MTEAHVSALCVRPRGKARACAHTRTHSRTHSRTAATAGLMSVLLCAQQPHRSSADTCANLKAFLPRLHEYCNAPASTAGQEGDARVHGATLLHASTIIRHGDRSAIHVLPDTERVQWLCERPTHAHVAWASDLLRPRYSSAECVATGACDSEVDPRESDLPPRVQSAMNAWSKTRATQEPCGPTGGELSTLGWEQLESIGKALAARYKPLLLQDTPGTSAMRVTTTDTGRTALSATAFLRGFLSGVLGADATRVDAPAAGADAGLEAIPQFSLPLPLHVLLRARDPLMFGLQSFVCPHAKAYEEVHADEVFQFARLPEDFMRRVSSISGVPLKDLPPSEHVVDDIFTRLCHGQPLACWSGDAEDAAWADDAAAPQAEGRRSDLTKDCPGLDSSRPGSALAHSAFVSARNASCLTAMDGITAVMHGDLFYSTRFSSKATELLLYPFFRQLAQMMRHVLERSHGAPRILIRAAHDTVISPILSALGLRDRLHAWPGYAHRISFEMWSVPGSSVRRLSGRVPPEEVLNPPPMMRMLYQGADITASTPCAVPYVTSAGATVHWCPLSNFDAMVESFLHVPTTAGASPANMTWDARCHMPLHHGTVARLHVPEATIDPVLPRDTLVDVPLQHTHATRTTA